MDSIIEVQEDVSDPLKHLLSLDWNSSVTLTAIQNNFEPTKSVKRVRFSDEVEKISYNSCDEKNFDIPFAHEKVRDDFKMNADLLTNPNENKTNIFTAETEFTNFDEVENSVNNINEISSIIYDTNNMPLQGVEDSINDTTNQNSLLVIVNYENNQLQSPIDLKEATDLNEVTNKVENLSLENTAPENITSVFPAEPVLESSNFDIYSVGNFIDKEELKSHTNDGSSVSLKRRVKNKLYNQKQSWKLNSVFTENSYFANASELNSAVFKAWCDVKNKPKSVETAVLEEKNVSNKLTTSNSAYLSWKKSKTEAQKKAKKNKTISNFSSVHQEISKNSKEEIEMAFKAWKKKKDDLLKQKVSEKTNKERERVVDSLMEKKERKLQAEAALNAWKQHKSHLIKLEKKRRSWVMQKKREEEEKKIMRDQEALVVYHMWLESKSSFKHDTFSPVKTNPPWTPPGKSGVGKTIQASVPRGIDMNELHP